MQMKRNNFCKKKKPLIFINGFDLFYFVKLLSILQL